MEILQKQFLGYKTIGSLGDELLGDETQEVDPYANKHECRSYQDCKKWT